MDAHTVEEMIWFSSFSLVATLGLGIAAMSSGLSGLRHPQFSRYLIVVLGSLFVLAPAWRIIISGAWELAYGQLGDWWSIPVIGWIVVIGFWCSVFGPATIILALITVWRRPARSVRASEHV